MNPEQHQASPGRSSNEAAMLVIDKGNASKEVIYKRLVIVNSINELEKQQAMETAQKAKIKMAIEDLVKKEFLNHFKNRFGRPNKTRLVLVTEFPRQLNSIQHMDMKADVTIKVIKYAIWDCGTDKSPGPNGFSFDFYRCFWSGIQKDMVAAVKCFFHYGSIPKGCNSSFIALIPKIPDAKMVKDFSPISLIGSLYKIIAKIMANRLVTVLGDVINEIQSAFVADRQILDGWFILNEVLQWCKLKKKQSFIFKIDFEKAYDSVQWDYLEDVLKKFGFREKWCKWIRMFKGIVLNLSMVLSHMAFGLHMNMSKSKIMGIVVNGDKVDQVAYRIGCGILKVPFTYLGSKVGGCMSHIQNWNDVVENISSRLSKWKMKTLSIGGRLTLIKAVLGAMPIYHMSIFKATLARTFRREPRSGIKAVQLAKLEDKLDDV
nr:RNA-directed DNA polymerase, eukaryota, reverse transcriptase zinc-binding domain protein [Tanacetum cinerariifolium]